MRFYFSIATIIVGSAFATDEGMAGSPARACTPLVFSDFDTMLPKQPPVLFRDLQFEHLGRPYSVTTFSDTAPGEGREQCFRYEVENTSQRDVQMFWWKLANIRADVFSPGRWNRRSKVAIRPISESPIDIQNDVFAFENERSETRAWSPRERQSSTTTFPGSFASLTYSEPNQIVPGLGDLLKEKKLPNAPIAELAMSTSGIRTETLRDYYTGFGFNFEVRSDAVRAGDEVWIWTKIELVSKEYKLQVAYPALSALNSSQESVAGLKDYAAYASRVLTPTKGSSYSYSYLARIPVSSLRNNSIYLMEYPVAIRSENSEDCFLVASYAPLAVSFGMQNCPTFLR